MAISAICSIPDCGKVRHARAMCYRHYSNLRNTGDPIVSLGTRKGAPSAFIEKVLSGDIELPAAMCLTWPYSRSDSGYGGLKVGRTYQYAHRVICEAVNGPPPSHQHEAAHSCGKGHLGCIDPRHLAWKTHAENHADCDTHGTRYRGDAHTNSKLKAADIPIIRQMATIETQTSIARSFGVSVSTINDVMKGKTWAHV